MYRSSSSSFITRSSRELGIRPQAGDNANLHRSLSSSIKVHHTWDPRTTVKDSDHGGVFNFDFSKNGSLLGVACERKSVLLFDPFNGQMVASKTNAHTDCVNCVKFLDDRLFATCSDDTNVALWDARYLKHHVQMFHGHSNWVKNIEYDSNQGMLLTSGFDGCIYTWNINRYSNEETSNRVFSTSGLMRSKLSPDFTKLLISTHEGYIIVIHNLDLATLGEDLKGFKPNMYHLMQRSQTPLRIGLMYNHVFEQERNRVEFINDWPSGNDANIVSSIQVHPQGWCVLSRNADSSEKTEWTCVHDIQDYTRDRKQVPHPWELEGVTPHTSAALSSSTNTPAFSSVAPSHLRGTAQANNDVQNSSSGHPRSSSTPMTSQNARNDSNEAASSSPDVAAQTGPHESVPMDNSTQEQGGRTTQATLNQSARDLVNRTAQELANGSTGDAADSSAEEQINGLALDQDLNNFYMGPEPSAEGSMHVRDSLIQIRRGARNSDGQFSFSISVHTATGRTIEFNQEDLDSADDDDFVVEQIITNGQATQNSTVNGQQGNEGINASEGNTQIDRSSTSANISNDSDREEADSDHTDNPDFVELNIDNDADDEDAGSEVSGTSEHNRSGDGNASFSVAELLDNATSQRVEQDVSEDDGDDDVFIPYEEDYEHEPLLYDSDDSEYEDEDTRHRNRDIHRDMFREQLFRSTMGPQPSDVRLENFHSLQSAYEDFRYARRNTLNRSANVSQSAADRNQRTEDESTDTRVSQGRRSSRSNNQSASQTQTGLSSTNSTGTQPRTNTFMFVVQSNSGDRRRRILNLNYMDSYTERENNALQKNIHSNRKRLLGYMEECNEGRGFIKEVAFSADGRLISSPFGFGLRIFAFDQGCHELCDYVPTSPVKLYEVTCSLAHVNCVVATKFSPTHNMVVSGCLDGKIAFHQPIL